MRKFVEIVMNSLGKDVAEQVVHHDSSVPPNPHILESERLWADQD